MLKQVAGDRVHRAEHAGAVGGQNPCIGCAAHGSLLRLIVPTLCVGMPPWTLCVRFWDAGRPGMHSHAERGNDHHATTLRPNSAEASCNHNHQ
ncbi:hypothetical protein FJ692_27240 [Pseudomonas fluorescens]|nr:hypothetical protein FJ692_27240 [Pseudomonas fluorescens]